MTRSVRDAARVLEAIEGPGVGDPYWAPPPAGPYSAEVGRDPGRLRVGVLRRRTLGEEPIDPECVRAVDRCAALLDELGHGVELDAAPAALSAPEAPIFFEVLATTHAARLVEEIAFFAGRELGPDDFEAYTWHLVERGRAITGAAYIGAYEWLQRWTRDVASWWDEGFDLLVLPTLAAPPAELGWLADSGGSPDELLGRVFSYGPFTAHFNVTGQPAISLPLHWSEAGLPVGVQLVAASGREDLLLRVASQLEAAEPWNERRPPICA